MTCWPSGKYVHLLYMYSIYFNYCLNSAWRWSVCGTAEVVWKPRFLWQWPSAHLHFLVSCFSFSSWQYPIDSLWSSGLVSLLASQTQRSFNQLLVLLAVWTGAKSCWKMKSAYFKSWSAEGSMNILVNGCSDVGFQKTQWTNTSR